MLSGDGVQAKGTCHLDFRLAHQAVLKGWLFVHIPATYSLLLLSVLHIIIVHAFDGAL